MQVKDALEALRAIGQVGVVRSAADANGGYEWSVTLLTELSGPNGSGELSELGLDARAR